MSTLPLKEGEEGGERREEGGGGRVYHKNNPIKFSTGWLGTNTLTSSTQLAIRVLLFRFVLILTWRALIRVC